MNAVDGLAAYVAAVLTLYADMPDTPLRPGSMDQWLASKLHRDGVPLPLVEAALLLATLRRLTRGAGLPPLPRIRSFAYFMPVIEELQLQPLPDGYVDYLRLKLRKLSQDSSRPDVQKTTFSNDR